MPIYVVIDKPSCLLQLLPVVYVRTPALSNRPKVELVKMVSISN